MASGAAPPSASSNSPSEQKRKEALQCLEASSACGDPELQHAKMREAQAFLEESLRINPANQKSRFLLVSCLMNLDDFERAKAEGKKIYDSLTAKQRRDMGDAVLHISIAHASKMLGQIDEAISFAKEASELYPNDPHPHMILGELYEASGMNHEAEQRCRQALRHHEELKCKHTLKDESVYYTLCCLSAALIKQQKYTEAERFLNDAVGHNRDDPLAQRHLVDVYHFQGRCDEAIQLAQRLIAQDPGDEEIRMKLEVLQHGGSDGEWTSGHEGGGPHGRHTPGGGSQGSFEVVDVPRGGGGRERAEPRAAADDGGPAAPHGGLAPPRRSSRSPSVGSRGHRSGGEGAQGRAEEVHTEHEEGGSEGAPKRDGGGLFCCCFDRSDGPSGEPSTPRRPPPRNKQLT